jgi:uncharacterized protein (DUF2235 family)
MGKTIVFCADDAWQGPAEAPDVEFRADVEDRPVAGPVTNVVKLYANLAGTPTADSVGHRKEQEKVATDAAGRVTAVAKYVHGVGDGRDPALGVFGDVFGGGVIARIVRGYTFLSRSHDPGDTIHLVGFSRGAYTARALAGMIAAVGLLNPAAYDADDKREAYRRAIAAWARAKSLRLADTHRLGDVANRVFAGLRDVTGTALRDDDLVHDVSIASVAVWDTVGPLGIPEYVGRDRVDVLRFADRSLSPKVAHGFHAMAIDELRRDFPVTRWLPREGVEEVWFVGAHGDVGGGYEPEESALADVALGWTMQKLATLGVRFAVPLVYGMRAPHTRGVPHRPWRELPFALLPTSPRTVAAGDVLHTSVKDYWDAAEPSWRPDAMRAFADTDLAGMRWDAAQFPGAR